MARFAMNILPYEERVKRIHEAQRKIVPEFQHRVLGNRPSNSSVEYEYFLRLQEELTALAHYSRENLDLSYELLKFDLSSIIREFKEKITNPNLAQMILKQLKKLLVQLRSNVDSCRKLSMRDLLDSEKRELKKQADDFVSFLDQLNGSILSIEMT